MAHEMMNNKKGLIPTSVFWISFVIISVIYLVIMLHRAWGEFLRVVLGY